MRETGPAAGTAGPGVMSVRKAVVPAAGMGTRFLPATKSMPKEMLPIIDKPVLQFVLEEAVASGIDDILIITGRGKQAIENHFDYNPELEAFLRETGRTALIDQIRDLCTQAKIYYVRQRQQLGLGHAVSLARDHVGDEPFAVLLGDTIIDVPDGRVPGLRQLLEVYEQKKASVVAVHEVPRRWVSRYGVVEGTTEADNPRLLRLKRLVEKPRAEEAPSTLAIAGRYVFTPAIFDCLGQVGIGVGGEIQLTDAINLLAQREPVYGLVWEARRYDIGNRVEYARCFIDFALRRPDTGPAIREHITRIVSEQQRSGG